MFEVVQRIEGKVCPIRKPITNLWTVNMDPVIYEFKQEDCKCTRDCAMFSEGYKNEKGYWCLEKDAVTAYQECRMWPGE